MDFGFTDCTGVPQGPQLDIPAAAPAESPCISIRGTGRSAYKIMAKALRRFRGWFTVRAVCRVRAVFSRVHALVRALAVKDGTRILRQSAILNI